MGNPHLIGLLLLATTSLINAGNLWAEIKARPNLSEAKRIIEQDSILGQELSTKSYTAFIPDNEAILAYEGKKGADLIKYHLANIPYMVQNLPNEINSDQMGNPKLFVSRFPSGKPALTGWENVDYYINNAKITYANVNCTADSGYPQVLQIIDQVILPTAPENSLDSQYFYPDAMTLLNNPQIYGLKDKNSINKFEERVKQLKLMESFAQQGSNTFFIPIDQALTAMIDKQVVHGHIVPDRVLFTRTAVIPKEEHPSVAYTDNLKVLISMEVAKNPVTETDAFYVKSNTKSGDQTHKVGTVLARIVHGNIPVRNGVVHLIDRPLMVVAASIMSYLEEEDGQLKLFHELMREHYNELSQQLKREKADLTLFAPSNQAFEMVNKDRFKSVKLNKEKLGKLLKLHIVPRRLTTDMIIDKSSRQEETLSNQRKLYFAVNDSNPANPIVSLEGAGVNATITTQNIAAKNGVIHIINRILGIPSETVGEKLGTDPMLSDTASLAAQDEWVNRLNNRDVKFTIFAPSNDAWDYIKREMPSAHKKLFMGKFAYHVRNILERHMIASKDLNLDELVVLTSNGTIRGNFKQDTLQMARGKIYFQAKVKKVFGEVQEYREVNPKEYYVEWNGIQARVVRPDVECVNGVVHVIDKVLMMNRDVTINASPSSFNAGHFATLAATAITLVAAKLLH